MLLPAPLLYPRRRKPRPKARPVPPVPPADLNLVAAAYSPGTPAMLTLTFDRAIDIAGLDGSVILVRDGSGAEVLFSATGGAALSDPATVELTLAIVEGDSAPGVVLIVSPENGIVAVDDGGTWGGVAELALPFP